MSAANHIYLGTDAGTPVTAFTTKRELQAYLRCRLDTFAAPLLLFSGRHDSGLPRHCLPRRYIGSECGQEWPNTNRSLESRRSTETDGQEVPRADVLQGCLSETAVWAGWWARRRQAQSPTTGAFRRMPETRKLARNSILTAA